MASPTRLLSFDYSKENLKATTVAEATSSTTTHLKLWDAAGDPRKSPLPPEPPAPAPLESEKVKPIEKSCCCSHTWLKVGFVVSALIAIFSIASIYGIFPTAAFPGGATGAKWVAFVSGALAAGCGYYIYKHYKTN